MFYKNQFFYAFISFCVFSYALFHYFRYKELESPANLQVVSIVSTSCSAAPRLASGLKILKNHKEFSVELPYDSCSKYSIGDHISLIYDQKFSRFYLPDYFRVYRFRAMFTMIIFIMTVLPWKRITQVFLSGGFHR